VFVLGADIGGTTTRVGRFAVGSRTPEAVLDARTPADIGSVPGLVAELADDLGGGAAVGIGAAGIVEPGGRWRWMPHATGSDVLLGEAVAECLGVAVVVENDATMALVAESREGAGSGSRTVLGVFLGTGIGGAVTIDGDPLRGRGGAGEFGHMRMADAPGCACGGVGCWEALVSGRVLDAGARELLGPEADGTSLVEAAGAGDIRSQEALATAGRWLGDGLAVLALAFDPDVIVLGGGVMQGGEVLMDHARARLEATEGAVQRLGIPPIRRAAFGSLAGLVGAAMAAEEMLT
jgi:glucokinase